MAVIFTTDKADARRRRHRHHARHHVARDSYSPPYASIVVDANSGAVLQATNADALRHPASLTKIMTLYLLFERLEAGKIKLDSRDERLRACLGQAPTKLGLRPGQTLRSRTRSRRSSPSRPTTPPSSSPKRSPATKTISPS